MAFTPRQAPDYQGAAGQMSQSIGKSEMMTYAHYKRQRDEKREDARIQKKKDDRDYVMKSLTQGIGYGRMDERNRVLDAQSDRQFKLQETELQQQQSTNIAKTQSEMNTSYRTELKQKQAEHAAYVKGINADIYGPESKTAMGFDQWVNLPQNKMKQKYTSIDEARRFYNDPQGYTGATSNDGLGVDGEIDDEGMEEKFFPEEPSISELESKNYSEETSLTSQTQGGSIGAAAISPEEYAQQGEDAEFVGAETVETREAERIARRKQRAKDELARQTELRRQEIRRKDDEKYAKKHGLTFTEDTKTKEELKIESEEAYEGGLQGQIDQEERNRLDAEAASTIGAEEGEDAEPDSALRRFGSALGLVKTSEEKTQDKIEQAKQEVAAEKAKAKLLKRQKEVQKYHGQKGVDADAARKAATARRMKERSKAQQAETKQRKTLREATPDKTKERTRVAKSLAAKVGDTIRKAEIKRQQLDQKKETAIAAKKQEQFAEKRTSDFVKKHGGDDKPEVKAKAKDIDSLAKLVKDNPHRLKIARFNGELTPQSLRKLPALIKKDPEIWNSLSKEAKTKIIQAMKKSLPAEVTVDDKEIWGQT